MARYTVDSPSNDKLSRMLRVTNSDKEISKDALFNTFKAYGNIKDIREEDVQRKSTWSVIIIFEKTKYTKAAYENKKNIRCSGIKLELSKVDSTPKFILETSAVSDSDSSSTTPSSPLNTPSLPNPKPGSSVSKSTKNEPTCKTAINTPRTSGISYPKSYTFQVEESVILKAFKNSELGYYKSYPLSFIVLSRYLDRQKFWMNQRTNNLIRNANCFVSNQTYGLKDLKKPGLEQLFYWSTVLFHTLCYIDCKSKLTSSAPRRGNQLGNKEQPKYLRDTRENFATSLEVCIKSALGIIFKEIGSILNGHFSGKRSESLSENVCDNIYSFWSFLEDASKQARLPQPVLDIIMAGAHNTFRVFGYNNFLQNLSKSCRKDEAEMFVKLCDLQNHETKKEDLPTLVTSSFLLRDAAKYVVKVWKYIEKNRGRMLLDEIADLQKTSNGSDSNSNAVCKFSSEAMRLIACNCSKIALSDNQERTDKKSAWEDLQKEINLSNYEEIEIYNKELLEKKNLLISDYFNAYLTKHSFDLSIIEEKESQIPMPWMYSDEKDVAHELLAELGFK